MRLDEIGEGAGAIGREESGAVELVLCEQAVELGAVDDAIEDVRGSAIRLRAARHHATVVAEARKLLEVGRSERQAASHVVRRADEVYVVDRHGRMLTEREPARPFKMDTEC